MERGRRKGGNGGNEGRVEGGRMENREGHWVECFALCLLTSFTVFNLNLAKNSTYKTDNKGYLLKCVWSEAGQVWGGRG